MKIKCLMVGPLEVNCYIVVDGGEAAVIDPGGDAERIINEAQSLGGEIKKIILTHGHYDHIGGVKELAGKTKATVYVHKEDEEMLSDSHKNLNFLSEEKVDFCSADVLLEGGEEIKVGDSNLKIYHTPGHSKGGISIACENVLFTGDLLFKNSIGRFDFGNVRAELKSLGFVVKNFPKETIVYPGHGEFTTIGDEMKYNPYIINHVKGR